jgi:hypothetical protein
MFKVSSYAIANDAGLHHVLPCYHHPLDKNHELGSRLPHLWLLAALACKSEKPECRYNV